MNISQKNCKAVKLPNNNIIDHIKEFKKYFPNTIYKKRYDIKKIKDTDCLCAVKIEDTLEKYKATFISHTDPLNCIVITSLASVPVKCKMPEKIDNTIWDAKSLVDAAYDFIFNWTPNTEAQKLWKNKWLNDANMILKIK